MRAAVSARSGAVSMFMSMSMRPPQCSENLGGRWLDQPPDGGLVDRAQSRSGSRLRVGGDQIKAGFDGVVLGEGFDETKDGEHA